MCHYEVKSVKYFNNILIIEYKIRRNYNNHTKYYNTERYFNKGKYTVFIMKHILLYNETRQILAYLWIIKTAQKRSSYKMCFYAYFFAIINNYGANVVCISLCKSSKKEYRKNNSYF